MVLVGPSAPNLATILNLAKRCAQALDVVRKGTEWEWEWE